MGKNMLEQFGYTTLTAENGERAIEMYKKRSREISLVLLDLGMPGMGGHQCLIELHRINPKVKVIVSSGYPFSEKMKESLDARAEAFIGKPYQLEKMLKKVREVLDQ